MEGAHRRGVVRVDRKQLATYPPALEPVRGIQVVRRSAFGEPFALIEDRVAIRSGRVPRVAR